MQEQFQRPRAQTLAGLGEGRVGWLGLVGTGVEVTPNHGDAAIAEKRAGDDKPDDLVGPKAALPLALSAGQGEDGKDGRQVKQTIQRGKQAQTLIEPSR